MNGEAESIERITHFSDVFWTLNDCRGGDYFIRDGLVLRDSNVFSTTPEMGWIGDEDPYGYDMPSFCRALLSTDWQRPEAVLAYHNAYGFCWGPVYMAKFPDGSAPLADAVARFQAEVLALRTVADMAVALRDDDRSTLHHLVWRCQRAKDVRQQMCLPITGESFQEYTRDTDAWYGVGSDGTMVRFLGRTSPLVSDTDMKALLESVPLLPNEWEAVRDAWAADETPCPWACASDDRLTEDARDEMQDILRIPSARPYFETGGRLGSPRFYLSWELHCLADFVRLGIAMYLARNLLPTHCASESCQRYFIPTRPRQVYCSKECQRAEAVRRYRRRRAPRSA